MSLTVNNIYLKKFNKINFLNKNIQTKSPINLSFKGDSFVKQNNKIKTKDFTTVDINNLNNKAKEYVKNENKQTVEDDIFFIDAIPYRKNKFWSYTMNKSLYITSMYINQKINFDDLLSLIETLVNIAYKSTCDNSAAIKRETARERYYLVSNGRGGEYFNRYKEKISNKNFQAKTNKENISAKKTSLEYNQKYNMIYILFPQKNFDRNLILAKKSYDKLQALKNPTENEINQHVATIRWLLAQATPYYRRSDSIGNMLAFSIYHAYNMKLSPLKKGCSLDFEAFDTNLNDYVKNFPTFFKEKPEKINCY